MTTAAEILEAVLALPEMERLQIAKQIADSVPPPGVMCEGDPGFFDELDRRSESLRSGTDPGVDAFEALAEIERDFEKRGSL